MTDKAPTTLKELCDEASESIRRMEPRWLRAEVVSVRQSSSGAWMTVVDQGCSVDVLVPSGRLSDSKSRITRGMVLNMRVKAELSGGQSSWFFLARYTRLARSVGPVERNRERARRALIAEGVIRRRALNKSNYARTIRGVSGARRVTALVPKSGREGWQDVAGELGHLSEEQLTVVPVGGRGRTMAEGCTDFLSRVAPEEADIVAIVRGGGNKAGLAEFDDPDLARAIHASPIPVVTAIGHRADMSLADAAAYAAFPTPGQAGNALSFASNGPGAVRMKEREAQQARLKSDLSESRRTIEKLERELRRERQEASVESGRARRSRREADEAHRWINTHLVEDAVGRISRQAQCQTVGLIALSLALLTSVAFGAPAPAVAVTGAAVSVILSIWVQWGPVRATSAPRRGRSPHGDLPPSTDEWRLRVMSCRKPRELRALGASAMKR